LLSAGALTTYVIIYHELTASVAFTTIAVLNQIEAVLAILPELITNAIDAFVSINRIEKFLYAPDLIESRTEGDEIIFKDARIAWPTDDLEEDPEKFILRDVNLHFPKKELSVISGKTGSGKTLLLNALLGEIELLGGEITMPRAPSLEERFDHQANKSSWIIENAVAYVPQIPWIENASIKENILFGLPYDAGRYRKTIKVCALEKDLEILQDGEDTEVGSTGIGLSGGQRWRVSFARALYSRAGILILDDIFSAVDAHVGRQLFEEALTGELGIGRTRILVTHHVGLVLPQTKFMVMLGDGRVENSGTVAELSKAGILKQILESEEKEEAASSSATLGVEDAGENALAKVTSRASEHRIDDGGLSGKNDKKPKKFIEEEKREVIQAFYTTKKRKKKANMK
jgi:ABC-type multidrug transport system fused ATPase/permease subunit